MPVYAQSAFDDPGARASSSGSGGGFTAVSSKVDADAITLGASSQVVILFQNGGGKPVNTGVISLYPSSNVSASVAKNECAMEPVAPGVVCAIAISVKGLQPGKFRIEMLMRHDGRTKLITSTVSGQVESSDDKSRELINDIEAIPADMDFGSLDASRPQIRSVILRNVTSKPVSFTDIGIDANVGSGFELDTDCTKLDSGQACIAAVTWTPRQEGPATGVLKMKHTGPTGVASVALNGIYEPTEASEATVFPRAVPGKGLLTASQTEIDFGSGIETSSAITVSLVNVGDAPISLYNIHLSNDENGIRILENGCTAGTILDPVEACPLTLTWEPTREGDILDDIQISHNGARGILILPLRGSATKAVNKDSKAIILSDTYLDSAFRDIPPIPASAVEADDSSVPESDSDTQPEPRISTPPPRIDVRGVLDGFKISSLATSRAIITGPGGSRVVFNGEETVIGGVLWTVGVRRGGVDFTNGDQRVLLPFDKSLSSFDSGISSSSGSTATATP